MSYSNINNPANYQLATFGQKGFRKINSGFTPVSDEYYRVVYAMEDSTVTVVAESGDSLTSELLLAGTAIYGLFSAISCSSGTILAYIA